ncbi:MAG: hypothetical protein WDW36_003595 [Sanguina aurantia]
MFSTSVTGRREPNAKAQQEQARLLQLKQRHSLTQQQQQHQSAMLEHQSAMLEQQSAMQQQQSAMLEQQSAMQQQQSAMLQQQQQQQQRGEPVGSVEAGEEKEAGDGEGPSAQMVAPACDEERQHHMGDHLSRLHTRLMTSSLAVTQPPQRAPHQADDIIGGGDAATAAGHRFAGSPAFKSSELTQGGVPFERYTLRFDHLPKMHACFIRARKTTTPPSGTSAEPEAPNTPAASRHHRAPPVRVLPNGIPVTRIERLNHRTAGSASHLGQFQSTQSLAQRDASKAHPASTGSISPAGSLTSSPQLSPRSHTHTHQHGRARSADSHALEGNRRSCCVIATLTGAAAVAAASLPYLSHLRPTDGDIPFQNQPQQRLYETVAAATAGVTNLSVMTSDACATSTPRLQCPPPQQQLLDANFYAMLQEHFTSVAALQKSKLQTQLNSNLPQLLGELGCSNVLAG